MRNLGIKYQLRIITLIPVLVVALLFALFYNAQYNKNLKQQVSRLGQVFINQLLSEAQHAIQHKNKTRLQILTDAFFANPEIQTLAFYNAKGELLSYRGNKNALKTSFTPPKITNDFIVSKASSAYSINFLAPIRAPKASRYSPFNVNAFENGELIGWVSMNMDTKFILLKRYQMYIATIFITLGGLAFGLLIHYILSRRVYQPIARLRRSMRQIILNEFETQINASSSGELGIIEQGCAHLQTQYLNTIKDMNQCIEVATADLQQSLELLEEKNIELSLEKKKTEEKSRKKSEFIANMSHEIRTPMNGVIGFTNVLLESHLDPLQLDYVKTIQSSAHDLLSIINDILDYSKIDAGKLNLDCIPLNIRTCIDDVLALIAPNAHSKGVDLIPITDIDVPHTVLGDPLRLKQIISSLVSNAVKFTDFGYILIRTRIEQASEKSYTLCFSITDTGIGIAMDDQVTLFHAFNQANTTITRRFGGSGLGLVICKKLAEHMQGRIVIDSELHKGSTFSVYLTFEKLAAYEVEKKQTHRFSNLRVICFDDNPLHLDALCNGLAYWGVTCIRVSEFNQLNQIFAANPQSDLAFINVNQGCEQQVAHVLRQQSMPCLLVSKWFVEDHQALGAQGLLFKPPNIQKLHDVIESTLNQSSLAKTNHTELTRLRQEFRQAKLSILIAEDNIVNQMLLNSLLGKIASIHTVDDGEQAVMHCNQTHFALILLDLQMPKLNGIDAARLIRQESMLNKNSPIVLISANGSDINKEQLQKAGIELCLQKPIDEKRLLQHLLEIVKKTNPTAINWPLCVQRMSGNHALAVEFLARFIEELQKNRAEFLQLFHHNDSPGLEDIAHKLNGACCFCGVPQLQKSVAHLENMAKQAKNCTEIHTDFYQLIECIDDVLEEYRHSCATFNLNMES